MINMTFREKLNTSLHGCGHFSHAKFWDITLEALRAKVPAERFAPTETKIGGFAVSSS